MPPPQKAEPPHKMELTTNSLRNTTIAVDNDQLYYEIVTRFWHPHITKIRKLDAESQHIETIAELENEPGKEPRVRFGDEEWMPASQWLKWDKERVGGVFCGGGGVNYRWKTHKRRLQLVRADSDDKSPLVMYHPYKRHFFVFRMSRHAWLEIKPEVVESLDALIMSYLLVERRRRQAR
ncbi:hypothetical protein BD410DRAFT_693202, partial [Rickenella mellea]